MCARAKRRSALYFFAARGQIKGFLGAAKSKIHLKILKNN